MLARLRAWFRDIPLADDLQRRQAAALQAMLLVIIGGALFGAPLSLLTTAIGPIAALSLAVYSLVLVGGLLALAMLRRGALAAAAHTTLAALIVGIGVPLLCIGLDDNGMSVVALALPVALGCLLLGRRGLLASVIPTSAIIGLTALLEPLGITGQLPVGATGAAVAAPTYIFLILLLALFLDRFGSSLRRALEEVNARERELATLRDTLEAKVAERTAALQQSLDAVNAGQETIRALSAPILPVLDGVLVAPVVGALDVTRMAHLSDNLLRAVQRERAATVLIDITAISAVDAGVAQAFVQAAAAIRLLGATPCLVGVRTDVAQALAALDVNVRSITFYPTLREAVGALAASDAFPGGDL